MCIDAACSLGGLKAQETPGSQVGLIPNGDTAQGNINAGEAASNTGQGEYPLNLLWLSQPAFITFGLI